MPRCIDADKLLNDPYMQDYYQQLAIKNAKTIKLKEIVYGEWQKQIINKGTKKECLLGFICSVCGNKTHKSNSKFCDECGADMRKVKN